MLRKYKYPHLIGDIPSFIQMSKDIKEGKYKKELIEIENKSLL